MRHEFVVQSTVVLVVIMLSLSLVDFGSCKRYHDFMYVILMSPLR